MTTKAELLKRIRLNCQEYMGGPRACEGQLGHKIEDIEGCTCPQCAFYPFRFGSDPAPSKRGFALRQHKDGGTDKNKRTS